MTLRNAIRIETSDGRNYRILQSFTVFWSGGSHQVEEGEETDFASIPRFFWRLCPPWGLSMRAAAAHDSIYRRPDVLVTREQADRMFLEVMSQDGVAWWQRQIMYRAVQLFGWAAFRERKNYGNKNIET